MDINANKEDEEVPDSVQSGNLEAPVIRCTECNLTISIGDLKQHELHRTIDFWAEFVGWYGGRREPSPHFKVRGLHPLSGFVLDANGLLRNNVPIPEDIPEFK